MEEQYITLRLNAAQRAKKQAASLRRIACVAVAAAVLEAGMVGAIVRDCVNCKQERAEAQSRAETLQNECNAYFELTQYYQQEERQAASEAAAVSAQYIGDYTCTAYCCEKYAHICGTGDGITASGQPVQAGVTVAADPAVLPYGTVLYIEGVGVRIVQDTGALAANQLDVAVDTHQHALEWSGYGTHAVYIISCPAERAGT